MNIPLVLTSSSVKIWGKSFKRFISYDLTYTYYIHIYRCILYVNYRSGIIYLSPGRNPTGQLFQIHTNILFNIYHIYILYLFMNILFNNKQKESSWRVNSEIQYTLEYKDDIELNIKCITHNCCVSSSLDYLKSKHWVGRLFIYFWLLLEKPTKIVGKNIEI